MFVHKYKYLVQNVRVCPDSYQDIFKTSLPRSIAYWGITKKSDIMDKHKL